MGRIALSVPWTSPWLTASDVVAAHDVRLITRAKDWQPTRWQRLTILLRNVVQLFRESRGMDAVVVCTSTFDAVVAGLAMRLKPRTTLAVWDLLLPTSPRLRKVAHFALRRVDCWMVVRRGDIGIFGRYLGAPTAEFVPFPAFADPTGADVGEDGYLYSAGAAHRDWPTLISALRSVDVPARISTVDEVAVPDELRDRVTLLPMQSPEDGRRLVARASAICVPFQDVELPSGPVVIVDAMAFGKPVIATDVSGSRDYIVDGVTGRLVPPNNPDAMAAAVRDTLESSDARARMGAAAQEFARTELTPAGVLDQIVRCVQEHTR